MMDLDRRGAPFITMPSFPIPAGFEVPEGAEEGQDFDAVATFSLSEGQLTVKAVEGAPIEGYEEAPSEGEEVVPAKAEDEDFMSAVEKRMSAV